MTSQAEGFINLRSARPEDVPQIAPLMIETGAGVFEFLFEGLAPEGALAQILEPVIFAAEGPYSLQHHLVAERDGNFAGFINAFPACLIRDQDPGPIPQERMDHFAPTNEIMDWESFYLNSMAVLPSDRGHGIGQALLEGILNKARRLGFQNVTLQVWEGNEGARRLYERHRFAITRTAVLESHPMLPETCSLLMQYGLVED